MCLQYDTDGADGGGGGPGYSYWTDQRHQQMPGPSMMPPHQLGPSTLEYRPPPRRTYHAGPAHAAMVPGMMDESGLGSLTLGISYESFVAIVCKVIDNSTPRVV